MLKLLAVLFLIIMSISLAAQTPIAVDTGPSQPAQPEPQPRSDRPSRPGLPRLIWRPWVTEFRPNEAEKRLLLPSAEDEARFATFLRQPDTGLVHMFPAQRRSRVVSVNDLVAGKTPGFYSYACMYSFSHKKHGLGLNGWVDPRLGWAEIRLHRRTFLSGFTGDSIGLLVGLGDVPIEAVGLQTPGVTEVDVMAVPTDDLEAERIGRLSFEGFQRDGFNYRALLPISANTTYALRSINNHRADILVTFRVVRLFQDGSLTILWKRLKVYPKPSWKRVE
jgi:hypothetical protein